MRLRQAGRWLIAPLVVAVLMLVVACYLAGWFPHGSSAERVAVRSDLAAYDWEELGLIADEISQCQTEQAAYACAARYGLCDEDGVPGKTLTSVELADGTQVPVALVGIWHDVRSDGQRAGLSFLCAQAATTHAMNHGFESVDGADADSVGGWEASEMRQWLHESLWYELPPELRSRIVRVQKRTAHAVDSEDELADAGRLAGTADDWVEETSDLLWLPSASELCGSVPALEELGVDETMAAVYGAEGSQYRLFAAAGVEAFAPAELLVRHLAQDDGEAPVTWWLRTKTLEFDDGFWLVGTDGTPLNGLGEDARVVKDPSYAPDELWGPDHARGVVVGFCL